MRHFLPLLLLAPIVNAQPFGAGAPLPSYNLDPSWMQGAGNVTSLDVGKINADTNLDIIGLSQAEDRVFWLDLSTPTATWNLVSGDIKGASAICAIDVNFDNHLDLVVSSRWNRRIQLFINQTDGTFVASSDVATNVDTATSLHSADMDGDTIDDLVGISDYDGEVFWIKHNANGTFGNKQTILTTVQQPTQFEIVDFDNNGTLDVAVLDASTGAVAVFNNNGSASFTQSARLGSAVTSFTTAVFDGSRPDVIATSSTLNICKAYQNDNTGGFNTAQNLNLGINGFEISAHADLDQDGDLDILLVNYALGQTSWMQNRNGLTFDAPTIAANSASGPTLSLLTDTDGDSDVELIQASSLGDELTSYEGFGLSPYDAWLADFNLTSSTNPTTGDVTGNGIDNLTSYAFNISPLTPQSSLNLTLNTGTSGIPTGVFEAAVSDLGIEYVRRRGSASGLTYTVKKSDDLDTWTPVDMTSATSTVIDQDWERVRYLLPVSSDQQGFLQLEVSYSNIVTP